VVPSFLRARCVVLRADRPSGDHASGGRPVVTVPAQRAPGSARLGLPATIGPAFVAAIAYADPGNFATDFAAGARYGYLLVWVVVAANLAAIPIQYLSAKVGLATDRGLPHLCRERFSERVSWGLWVQAELVAMATELAELIGTALALHLLLGLPLLPAGVLGAAASFGVLALTSRGVRPFEAAVTGMMLVVVLGFAYQAIRAGLRPGDVLSGLVPRLADSNSLVLAVGIVGATVMPHAVYVHSALTIGQGHSDTPRRVLRSTRWDVLLALGAAGLVNVTMLAVAAGVFHGGSDTAGLSLEQVHARFGTTLGPAAALAFALALLASGVSSTSVGAYAGQVVMNGFTGWHLPPTTRRLITVAPALIVIALGVDPTWALVLSQVLLSFGIPFTLVPLLLITSDRAVMRAMVNRHATTVTVSVITAVISALNVFLVWRQVMGGA
jgi:manganese transport protein